MWGSSPTVQLRRGRSIQKPTVATRCLGHYIISFQENIRPHKNVSTDVHSSSVHKSQKVETTQIFIHWTSAKMRHVHIMEWKVKVLLSQWCLTICSPMDYSSPGSSVHGILQARILEWGAIPLSRGSSWPRNQTQVSHTVGRFSTVWATREAPVW